MKSLLSINNLSSGYGKNTVFSGVTFEIMSGDFVGLAGPNGAGKTTLIKALFGLVQTQEGEITLFGQPQKRFSDWYKIGYLPQKTSVSNPLFPATVGEVISLGLLSKSRFQKKITSFDRKKTNEVLHHLNIANLKNKMLSTLSGGQQQKVMLARALVSEPELLIFDEPSTALDPESRGSLFELIKKLNKEKNITIILITHDTGYVGQFANKLLYLDKKIIYYGTFDGFCKSEKMSAHFGIENQHIICHQHIQAWNS